MVLGLLVSGVAYAQNWQAESNKEMWNWKLDGWDIDKSGKLQKKFSDEQILSHNAKIEQALARIWDKYMGKVRIGMTDKEFLELIGKPKTINRSTGRWGVHEQWIIQITLHKPMYFYFENGILTAWQN